VKYIYTFNITRKSTLNEVFQAREFIGDLDSSKSLRGFCLPGLNKSLTSKDIFLVIRDQENSFNTLLINSSIYILSRY
jgi:hypothetical protein